MPEIRFQPSTPCVELQPEQSNSNTTQHCSHNSPDSTDSEGRIATFFQFSPPHQAIQLMAPRHNGKK